MTTKTKTLIFSLVAIATIMSVTATTLPQIQAVGIPGDSTFNLFVPSKQADWDFIETESFPVGQHRGYVKNIDTTDLASPGSVSLYAKDTANYSQAQSTATWNKKFTAEEGVYYKITQFTDVSYVNFLDQFGTESHLAAFPLIYAVGDVDKTRPGYTAAGVLCDDVTHEEITSHVTNRTIDNTIICKNLTAGVEYVAAGYVHALANNDSASQLASVRTNILDVSIRIGTVTPEAP